ncbi:transposase [Patescibacteria group bacterium]|nr:transposase [Patescibacteria group bacterium]MBU4099565.1 transposase [Patescibacteria group bacterium]
MKYNPDIHHRESIRLKGYDYFQNGAYFITICIQNRENRFGEIKNKKMFLNDPGRMIDTCWNKLTIKYCHITLDEFVVMPNHFHGIIIIDNKNVGVPLVGTRKHADETLQINKRAGTRPAPTIKIQTIGNIIGAFKSISTHEYINGVKNNNWHSFDGRLWQKNYYEHIIRDERSLQEIREYIINNPSNWEKDELYNELMLHNMN